LIASATVERAQPAFPAIVRIRERCRDLFGRKIASKQLWCCAAGACRPAASATK
jgi:hypothetical protein